MLQKPDKELVVDVFIKRVFGILVDTNASITNVLPVKKQDPSGRSSEQDCRLCRPYFLFPLEIIPDLVSAEVADSLEAPDRSDIAIHYPSEPCLVAGAINFMLQEPEGMVTILSDMLYNNKNLLSFNGGVGESGEFLAQMVPFMVFDRPWQQKGAEATFETKRAKLVYYSLKSAEASGVGVELLGLNRLEAVAVAVDAAVHDCACVLLTHHFIHAEDYIMEIPQDLLMQVWRRGAGILCRPGEIGANLVIPVMLPRRKGVPMDIHDEETYQMFAWLVQVKNWCTAVPAKALLEVLTAHPLIAGLVRHQVPFLFLVWNVQAHMMSQPHKDCTNLAWAAPKWRSQPASSSSDKPSAAFLMLLKDGLGTASDRNSSTKVSKVIPALSEHELEILDKFRVRYPGGARGYLEDVSSVLLQQQEQDGVTSIDDPAVLKALSVLKSKVTGDKGSKIIESEHVTGEKRLKSALSTDG
eukprot:gene34805-42150_t